MEGANLGAQGASEAFQLTRSWLDGPEGVDCFISRTKTIEQSGQLRRTTLELHPGRRPVG